MESATRPPLVAGLVRDLLLALVAYVATLVIATRR